LNRIAPTYTLIKYTILHFRNEHHITKLKVQLRSKPITTQNKAKQLSSSAGKHVHGVLRGKTCSRWFARENMLAVFCAGKRVHGVFRGKKCRENMFIEQTPFTRVRTNFCTYKNLHGYTLRLHGTGGTGLIFERLSV